MNLKENSYLLLKETIYKKCQVCWKRQQILKNIKKMNLISAGILRGLAYDYEKLEMLSNTVITKKEEELEEFSALDFFALIPKLLKF